MIFLTSVIFGTIIYINVVVFERKFDFYMPVCKESTVLKRIISSMNLNSPMNLSQNSVNSSENTSNVTVVTAFWNLGTFQKGSTGKLHFSTNTYFLWASSFRYLVNPLVVYTDSKEFKELMEKLRADQINTTIIYLINRTDVWPFQLTGKIKAIYSQPGYPKHHPNTVNPEYAAAQHAKYAVVANTVRKQIFSSLYYVWLDIGYFRDITSRKNFFEVNTPPCFESDKLAINRVKDVSMGLDPLKIFRNNLIWVGGGMFLGSQKVILEFEKLYHKAVLYFLNQNLMNTDQQVLYSLYSRKGRKTLKPNIELQLYIPKGSGNPWFYLGYICLKDV
ncbi:uncharacterized protein LOC133171765 [Saccostrea echinata]|uniref:uncharacterized protein LOC133171765 n=1 Tax=Saccostrea echinata TaxID=191078 RepID=UPI002A814A5C|nr:uncharacterized protein LOC133171765 [Saccostrea echinata]